MGFGVVPDDVSALAKNIKALLLELNISLMGARTQAFCGEDHQSYPLFNIAVCAIMFMAKVAVV